MSFFVVDNWCYDINVLDENLALKSAIRSKSFWLSNVVEVRVVGASDNGVDIAVTESVEGVAYQYTKYLKPDTRCIESGPLQVAGFSPIPVEDVSLYATLILPMFISAWLIRKMRRVVEDAR